VSVAQIAEVVTEAATGILGVESTRPGLVAVTGDVVQAVVVRMVDVAVALI
jgi:hypothetical protein